MLKKLLSLCLAFVLLCSFATPLSGISAETTFEAEAPNEASAKSFEAIVVKQLVGEGTTTLTGGYKPGSDNLNLTYNYGSTNPYHRWLYFKYDISELKNLEDIKSAVLSVGFNWNKNNGTLCIKTLNESLWNDAVNDIANLETDSSAVIDSAKYVYPKDDADTTTLGTVKRSYGNSANISDYCYTLTGLAYKQAYETTLTGSSQYRTATFTEGPLVKYIQDTVKNGKNYLYFSVCYYSTAAAATDRFGNYRFYSSANSIKASNNVMVIYNSLAGSKFNNEVTTLDRATDFTYSAVVATKDTNVRLLTAIYGKKGSLLDVVISDVISSNNGTLSLNVPLSAYPDATSVKCFVWDGNSPKPYAEAKTVPVKTEVQQNYSGKKAIFIGDSNVYWGRAVEARSSKNKLSERQNDKGIFYQICKENGVDISVTNWTYGSHGWWALFDTEECTVNDSCGGINHEEALTDRNYDYVFLGLTRSETDESRLDEYMTKITGIFREANPNVQIIVLAPSMIYGISDTGTVRQGTINSLKTMEAKYNVKIADWGRIVRDILEGTVTVPGTAQNWVKNTFVVKDKKHVNLLGGYITALMSYCILTGEKAEGQSYDFFKDSSAINVQGYVDTYYTNGDADTNFPEILASETEMLGIQKLIDKYIEEKPYLGDPSKGVQLTLANCDEAETAVYEYAEEVTLIEPTKNAKGGKYTFKNWSDGTKTYAAGEKITLTQDTVLTAQWDYESYGVISVEFDKKTLVKAGPYDSATDTYDNTVKEVTEDITGVQSVNTRKTANGVTRRLVYVTLDLTNEKKAEEVLLNILASRSGTAQGNYIYVETTTGVPVVGETISSDTERVASLKLTGTANGNLQKLDITETYNKALGTKLYLKIYGWAYADSKTYNYVQVNADTLKLDVTPYVEGKYTVTFDKGAEPIYANINSEITLPEYSIKIPGEKFAGWSDGTNTYRAGATYQVIKTTRFTALVEEDPDSMTEAQKLLDGKKIIFIGNSFIYYGRTVKNVDSDYCEQSKRINDTGGFYQLCKQNYIDVEVTNWTFGGHKLGDLFGATCTYSGCPCNTNSKKHEDYITDKYYDYVVVSPGSGERQSNEFMENIEYITKFFREANENVKIIILGNASGHGVGTVLTTIASNYKTLYNEGYSIADWGYLVKNIIDGEETVEGATEVYNKNTFIVKDGYHPNLLTGYITTLFTYCTITGEKALGQPHGYLLDSTTAPADIDAFVNKYYTNGDADTTFPEILRSEADIRGIQKLIDKYIEEKPYLDKY